MSVSVKKISHEGRYPHIVDVEMMNCPECGGWGTDGFGRKCNKCKGEGLVEKPYTEYVERPRPSRTDINNNKPDRLRKVLMFVFCFCIAVAFWALFFDVGWVILMLRGQ